MVFKQLTEQWTPELWDQVNPCAHTREYGSMPFAILPGKSKSEWPIAYEDRPTEAALKIQSDLVLKRLADRIAEERKWRERHFG